MFFIKYLRTLGFDVTNDIFAENAWYFRNAMVRANYSDLQHSVHETTEYLELFLRNLLLGEKNELHNRSMHISKLLKSEKVDIDAQKADIENSQIDIDKLLANQYPDFSQIMKEHVKVMLAAFGLKKYSEELMLRGILD